MEREKPESAEVSLACEISSYANAELEDGPRRGASATGAGGNED